MKSFVTALKGSNWYVSSDHHCNQQCLVVHTVGYDVKKVKVVPYTFVRKGVPVREDTYPEPSACEVGWPVPFLAAFISPVLPPGVMMCILLISFSSKVKSRGTLF